MSAVHLPSLKDGSLNVKKGGITYVNVGMQAKTFIEETWPAGQKQLIDFYPSSYLVIAEESGHGINLEQPEIIDYVIKEMVREYGKRIQ